MVYPYANRILVKLIPNEVVTSTGIVLTKDVESNGSNVWGEIVALPYSKEGLTPQMYSLKVGGKVLYKRFKSADKCVSEDGSEEFEVVECEIEGSRGQLLAYIPPLD